MNESLPESDQVQWMVPVRDVELSKDKVLVITVVETRVVMIPPPCKDMDLPDTSITLLCEAVKAAHSVAEHRRRGYRDGARS